MYSPDPMKFAKRCLADSCVRLAGFESVGSGSEIVKLRKVPMNGSVIIEVSCIDSNQGCSFIVDSLFNKL